MNPKDYVGKAITLKQIAMRRDINVDTAASIFLASGYPEPTQGGVEAIFSHRGEADGGIDWALRHFRRFSLELIENVINDCISAVTQTEGITEEDKERLTVAIRTRFEMTIH